MQPSIGCSGMVSLRERRGRLSSVATPRAGVELPSAREVVVPLDAAERARLERPPHNPRSALRPIAIEAHPVQPDDEGVVGHRAFDVEGAGLRVAAGRAARAVTVHAAGVHAPGAHRVAGVDAQRRRYFRREVEVKRRRLEVVRLRRRRRRREAHRRPLHGAIRKRRLAFELGAVECTGHGEVPDLEGDGAAAERPFDRPARGRSAQRLPVQRQREPHDVRAEGVEQGEGPVAGDVLLCLPRDPRQNDDERRTKRHTHGVTSYARRRRARQAGRCERRNDRMCRTARGMRSLGSFQG